MQTLPGGDANAICLLEAPPALCHRQTSHASLHLPVGLSEAVHLFLGHLHCARYLRGAGCGRTKTASVTVFVSLQFGGETDIHELITSEFYFQTEMSVRKQSNMVS